MGVLVRRAALGTWFCAVLVGFSWELLAEEEGFEPSVPRCGTPVFETGPFNHSGTPPENGSQLQPFTSLTVAPEKTGSKSHRIRYSELQPDLGPVIQSGIGHNSIEGTTRSRLGVGRPKDKTSDPTLNDRPGAHRAWLEGHVQVRPVESPGTQGPAGER